jgi:3-keto-5-aminohexanoate cleavage enzyme
MSASELIINFTPTGMIPMKSDTPFVPVSPSEIIEQVHEAAGIGITLVHLHARDENGLPAYKASIFRDIFDGIRKYCPDLVLCASLSGRNFPEIEKRTEVLSLRPDMGSLTLSSLNFNKQASISPPDTISELIARMDKYGVHPELECFDSGMINYAKYLIDKNELKPPFYFNLLFGNISSAQADAAYVGLAIRDLPEKSIWTLGGLGQNQLMINTLGIVLGGGVRVGIEDNIWLDNERKILATNTMLIRRIHQLAEIMGRKVMKPKTFGSLGFYNTTRT